MKNKLKLAVFSSVTILAGCVSVLPDPAPAASVYRMSSDVTSAQSNVGAETVRIDRPTVSEIFKGQDIVVSMNGSKLSAVAQARWAESTPVLVQTALINALSAHPDFTGLAPSSGARTETRLHLTIRNFEAKFDNGPESAPLAVVSYSVVYAKADDRKLLGTHVVRQTERAGSINVSSIVEAIQSANEAAMDDIVTWLSDQQDATPS